MAGERIIGFKINIQGSEDVVNTIGKLQDIIKQTNKDLKNTEIGSEEYKLLNTQLAEAKERLTGVRKEQRLQIKEAEGIKAASGSYRELNAELVVTRNRFKELSREDREGAVGKEATARIQALDKELKELDKTIGQSQRNVGNYASAFEGLNTVVNGSITDIATLAFGAGGIAVLTDLLGGAAGSVKDLTDEFFKLRGEVEQITGASGDDLDEYITRIAAIADTFGVTTDELLISANSLTEQLSGDFSLSLDAIEAGFLAGADANGELLDSLKEYSVQAEAAGLTTEELLNIVNTSTKAGIFSDKGIDTVKEFGLRIREQTKTTRDALLGAFGDEFTDKLLAGINTGAITTVEALKSVSGEINKSEIPVKRLQTLIADVFGGAGEDAGLGFIQSLENIGTSLEDLEGRNTDYAQTQETILALNTRLAEEQNELSKTFSDASTRLDTLSLRAQIFFTEVLTTGLNALSSFIGLLISVGSFLTSNLEIVTLAATAYAAYNAAIIAVTLNKVKLRAVTLLENAALAIGLGIYNALTFATAAYNGVLLVLTNTTKAITIATRVFNTVLRSNPLGLIITAIGLLITGIVTLINRFDLVNKALNLFRSDAKKLEEEEKKRDEARKKREEEAEKRAASRRAKRLKDISVFLKKRAEQERQAEEKARADAEKRRKEELKLSRRFIEQVRKDQEELDLELSRSLAKSIKEDEEGLEKRLALKKKEAEEEKRIRRETEAELEEIDEEEIASKEEGALAKVNIFKNSANVEEQLAKTTANKLLLTDKLTADQRKDIEEDLARELIAIQIKALEKSLEVKGLEVGEKIALEQELIAKRKELRDLETALITDDLNQRAQFIRDVAIQTIDIVGQFDEARRNRQITAAEEQAERDTQIAAGNAQEQERIAQRLADTKDRIDKQFRQREQKRAIATATINGALAVTKILAEVPKQDFGIATALLIALAVAQTAAEVAVISSQKFASGGVLSGPSHAAGGIPVRIGGGQVVEAEGGEAMINRRSTRKHIRLLDAINRDTGGAPLLQNGGVLGEFGLPAIGEVSQQSNNGVLALISDIRAETQAVATLALSIRQSQLTQRVILDPEELDAFQSQKVELDNLRTLS